MRRNYYLHDYLNVHVDRQIQWIVEQNGSSVKDSDIFCDFVTRINSKNLRRIKLLLICDKYIYLINPKNIRGQYHTKCLLDVTQISEITIPTINNKTLMKIGGIFE